MKWLKLECDLQFDLLDVFFSEKLGLMREHNCLLNKPIWQTLTCHKVGTLDMSTTI